MSLPDWLQIQFGAHWYLPSFPPSLADCQVFLWVSNFLSLFKYILLIVLLQLSHFFPTFYSPLPCTWLPLAFPPPLTSCPWVVHISSLTSKFPILFLTSPCPFCIYHLCFLFSVPFPLYSPSLSWLITLHVISISDSVPVLVVCSVWFCFFFRFSCWQLWVCCHFTVHSFDLFLG